MSHLTDMINEMEHTEAELERIQEELDEQQKVAARDCLDAILSFDEELFPFRLDLLYGVSQDDPRWQVGALRRCRHTAEAFWEIFDTVDVWRVKRESDGNYSIGAFIEYGYSDRDFHHLEVPALFVENDLAEARECIDRLVDEARRVEHEDKMREERDRERQEREMFAMLQAKYGA